MFKNVYYNITYVHCKPPKSLTNEGDKLLMVHLHIMKHVTTEHVSTIFYPIAHKLSEKISILKEYIYSNSGKQTNKQKGLPEGQKF